MQVRCRREEFEHVLTECRWGEERDSPNSDLTGQALNPKPQTLNLTLFDGARGSRAANVARRPLRSDFVV